MRYPLPAGAASLPGSTGNSHWTVSGASKVNRNVHGVRACDTDGHACGMASNYWLASAPELGSSLRSEDGGGEDDEGCGSR